ncbi:MAG: hypothetical protein GXN95_07295 [Methanococci archaeon]|nr:hypothetical protein [Methanococci archaeon]
MGKLKVHINSIDENLMFRSLDIKVGPKTMASTPIKVSPPEYPISPINEVYKKFSIDKLEKCNIDTSIETKTNQEIKKCLVADKLNMVIVDYTSDILPKKEHLEVLMDLQYNGNVVITPIFSKLVKTLKEEKLKDTFIKLTNQCIEIANTLNNKTIIGIIPAKMPRQFIDDVIKNYIDNNIIHYIIDLDRRTISANTSWIRKLFRTIHDNGILNETLLYCVNGGEGKFLKNAEVIPAHDFINSGFGVDVLGLKHVPPPLPPETWAKLKNIKKGEIYRIFNENTYGYHRVDKDSLQNLELPPNQNIIKLYNIGKQFNEANYLQNLLKEESTVEQYVSTKSQMKGIIPKIKKVKHEIKEKSTTLDFFL